MKNNATAVIVFQEIDGVTYITYQQFPPTEEDAALKIAVEGSPAVQVAREMFDRLTKRTKHRKVA